MIENPREVRLKIHKMTSTHQLWTTLSWSRRCAVARITTPLLSAVSRAVPRLEQLNFFFSLFQSFLLGLLGSGEPYTTINDLIGPLSFSEALNCKSRSRSHLTNLADPQTLLRKCLNPNDMNAIVYYHTVAGMWIRFWQKNRVRDSVP